MARVSNAVKEFGKDVIVKEIKFLVTEDDYFSLQLVAAVNRQSLGDYLATRRDMFLADARAMAETMKPKDDKSTTSTTKRNSVRAKA